MNVLINNIRNCVSVLVGKLWVCDNDSSDPNNEALMEELSRFKAVQPFFSFSKIKYLKEKKDVS